MPQTPNKGYEIQVTGSNAGTWGDELNDEVIDKIDLNLGGTESIALSSSNVVLSATQSQNAILYLTGTLLANIQVTTSCVGFFFVDNQTTGSFTVTVTNGVSGVVVPQSAISTLVADANGTRIVGESFESGTSQLFFGSTAPAGWTKEVSTDNALIRLVSGTPSTGGSNNFTDINSNFMMTRANLPNVTITTSTDGAHTHLYGTSTAGGGGGGSIFSATNNSGFVTTSSGTHNHSVLLNGGVTQTAFDFDIKYRDAIRATKD